MEISAGSSEGHRNVEEVPGMTLGLFDAIRIA